MQSRPWQKKAESDKSHVLFYFFQIRSPDVCLGPKRLTRRTQGRPCRPSRPLAVQRPLINVVVERVTLLITDVTRVEVERFDVTRVEVERVSRRISRRKGFHSPVRSCTLVRSFAHTYNTHTRTYTHARIHRTRSRQHAHVRERSWWITVPELGPRFRRVSPPENCIKSESSPANFSIHRRPIEGRCLKYQLTRMVGGFELSQRPHFVHLSSRDALYDEFHCRPHHHHRHHHHHHHHHYHHHRSPCPTVLAVVRRDRAGIDRFVGIVDFALPTIGATLSVYDDNGGDRSIDRLFAIMAFVSPRRSADR